MAIYSTSSIDYEYVKVRWQEPYVSNALNRKMFGILPKGIYNGFVIGPGGLSTRDIQITSGSVSGGLGTGMLGGYVSGNFDESATYSIAIHQNSSGWATTVSLPPGSLPIHLDATGLDGLRVYAVIDVNYNLNQATTANLRLVNSSQIDSNPSYIVIGYCDVPASPSTPLDASMFGYNDPNYPRLTPLATTQKAGFMPTSVWSMLSQNQSNAWQNLFAYSIDPNSTYVLQVAPSQHLNGVNNSKIYSYVLPNIASKFPRNSSGAYNGGALNDQYAKFNFTTGTISGAHQITGNTTFAIPSVSGTANGFQVGIIAIDSGDNISVSYGGIYTSLANAVLDDNLPVVGSSLFQTVGAIIQTNAGGVIQPFTTSSFIDRRPFLNLGGSGSGSGGASVAPASGFMSVMSSSFSTPKTSDAEIDSTKTHATQNLAKSIYALSCDKTKTVSSNSGTSLVISSTPAGFTLTAGDIVYATSGARSGQWRRITVVAGTTLTLDAAFTGGNASASDTLMLSQAFWTNDFVNVGDVAQSTRPRDFFPSVDVTSINVDYHDSLAAADGVPDYTTTANIVVSASNSGVQADTGTPTADTFASIFTRPTAVYPNNQVLNYSLLANATKQRLFLCFFPNPNNGSVTTLANLTDYKVSFYSETILNNGGYLSSAFCFSDSSGTPVNCSNPTVVSTKTRVALNWNFVPELNVGQTTGDLEVIVDGQVIPRYLTGTTVDAFYTETVGTTNTIDLWTDLSGFQRSIEIRRRQGSIDSSSANTTILAGLHEVTAGTAAQVTSGQAQYSSIQAAHDALASTGGLIRLVGTVPAENLIISKPNVSIKGKGRSTAIQGTILISVTTADYCCIKHCRITDNVTMSSNKSYVREVWLASGKIVTITGGTLGNEADYQAE